MGLTHVQELLARLYTEPALREQFFADPQGVGEALGLEPGEAERLARLPAAEIDRFARSLVHKRRGEVEKLLPLTHRALGPRFPALFREHAARFSPTGTKKPLEDAAAFAASLARRSEGPAWAGELARYEAAWLEATASGRRCLLRWFRYPVHHLARLVSAEETLPEDVPPQPALGVWLRRTPDSRWRHRVLSLGSGPAACRSADTVRVKPMG